MNKLFILLFFLLPAGLLSAQQKDIRGVVTDAADGSTLPGVSVLVKGTGSGAATDYDGNYTVKAGPDDILVFSFVGMKTLEINVNNREVINVQLSPDAEQLEEVVIIGYGTRKKGTVSGAVSTLKDEALKVPVASFDQALQGQVSGMSVMTSSGSPDAQSSIRIRGIKIGRAHV